MDLAIGFLGIDEFVGVWIDKTDFHAGKGIAYCAVDACGEWEGTGECHADFGHAITFEKDVA